MTEGNGAQAHATGGVSEILGVGDPIIVEFPCEYCGHKLADHPSGETCLVEDASLGYEFEGEGPERKLVEKSGPCPCESFEGLLENGEPRAFRLRMPSNFEWSTIQTGASLPARISPTSTAGRTPEQLGRHLEWMRKICQIAVTHVRTVNGWQPIRIVSTQDEVGSPWDISIDEFDRAGSGIVNALVNRLVDEFNDGGPFGGVVRGFRGERARKLSHAREDVRLDDASRDHLQPAGRSGGMDPSG